MPATKKAPAKKNRSEKARCKENCEENRKEEIKA